MTRMDNRGDLRMVNWLVGGKKFYRVTRGVVKSKLVGGEVRRLSVKRALRPAPNGVVAWAKRPALVERVGVSRPAATMLRAPDDLDFDVAGD